MIRVHNIQHPTLGPTTYFACDCGAEFYPAAEILVDSSERGIALTDTWQSRRRPRAPYRPFRRWEAFRRDHAACRPTLVPLVTVERGVTIVERRRWLL